jgi:hypothetical protein
MTRARYSRGQYAPNTYSAGRSSIGDAWPVIGPGGVAVEFCDTRNEARRMARELSARRPVPGAGSEPDLTPPTAEVIDWAAFAGATPEIRTRAQAPMREPVSRYADRDDAFFASLGVPLFLAAALLILGLGAIALELKAAGLI